MEGRSLVTLEVEVFTDGVRASFGSSLNETGRAIFLRELARRLVAEADKPGAGSLAAPMRELIDHELR